jgi:glyoxylase-like metal-dependent hydrolase (beta-lactamase superfamily II)
MYELNGPLTCGDLTFQPVPTPGHSRDHTVFLVPEKGWLFSGDLYLADRIKYFREDERIVDEISSLRKVHSLDFDTLFCSHNPKLKNGRDRIAAKLSFLEDIYGAVMELQKQGLGEKEIMRKIRLGEVHFIRWLTGGNVSAGNIVRSAIRETK